MEGWLCRRGDLHEDGTETALRGAFRHTGVARGLRGNDDDLTKEEKEEGFFAEGGSDERMAAASPGYRTNRHETTEQPDKEINK